MQQRLQKIISAAGLASRRAAEELISAGRVTVNGATATLGESADADTDDIRLDGKPVKIAPERVYIMLNKPRGYVTTVKDERGRKCVTELVSDVGVRLYPVGRLDLNSEGLLIMTNDGEAANALMHPSHGVVKTYRVTVTGEDISRSEQRLREDFELDGRTVRARDVAVVKRDGDRAIIDISISQGLNRQVRRMCDGAGLYVRRLVRISEGQLQLGNLKTGAWRHLTDEERKYIMVK
jgi:23S rRNA pseudouridine2605 synthase